MAQLTKEGLRRFQRLWASYDDLLWAQGFGEYIQRKKLHALPWARRKNSYFHAYAYTSAMITAYGRAILDLPERGRPALVRASLTTEEESMHVLIMKRRHEIFAHSDPRLSRARPIQHGDEDKYATTISSSPLTSFTADEIVIALRLIDKMMHEVDRQRNELLSASGFTSKLMH